MPRAKGQPRKLSAADQEWLRDALAFRRGLSNKALMRKFDISETTLWTIARKYDAQAVKPGQRAINNQLERLFEEFRQWRVQTQGRGFGPESTGDSDEIPDRLPSARSDLPEKLADIHPGRSPDASQTTLDSHELENLDFVAGRLRTQTR